MRSLVILGAVSACTLHHSKVPIADTRPIAIAPDAKFVTSDDSGLAILGLFVVSEPDHFAVLIERLRRRYSCAEVHHAQLDFYSDYWLFVSFPIIRVTAICNRAASAPESLFPPKPSAPQPPPDPVTPPDPPPPPQP